MEIDKPRLERVKQRMEKENIDVLIFRNTEGVLYLSGYWPMTGWSFVIFPLEGDPTLIIPASEFEYAEKSWISDIRTYESETLEMVGSPYSAVSKELNDIFNEPSLKKATVGYEGSLETVAGSHVCFETSFSSFLTLEMLRSACYHCSYKDATSMIMELRMVKTRIEIDFLKIANEIATFGLESASNAIAEGTKEIQVAASIENAVQSKGVGYRGVDRARGFAFVMSGPLAANAYRSYCISTTRRLRRGDLVLVELDTYADGYWSDLTRMFVIGGPTSEQQRIFDSVFEAQQEAIKSIMPGVKASDIDGIARNIVRKHGYEKYFLHRLGHGIGLRLHELPALHPASGDILLPGMVHSVEPGVYIPGFGGIRVEDDILDLQAGCEYVSKFERTLIRA